MNVLRSHDYPELTTRSSAPNLKTFRRILAGFVVSICVCLTVVIMMIVKQPHVPRHIAQVHHHCACGGRCLR